MSLNGNLESPLMDCVREYGELCAFFGTAILPLVGKSIAGKIILDALLDPSIIITFSSVCLPYALNSLLWMLNLFEAFFTDLGQPQAYRLCLRRWDGLNEA